MMRPIAEFSKGVTLVINKCTNIYINAAVGIFPLPSPIDAKAITEPYALVCVLHSCMLRVYPLLAALVI
jgi:hypothetical protein